MALLTDWILVDIVLAAAALIGLIHYYFTANYNYWQKRGVPHLKPAFFYGNVKDQIQQKKHFFYLITDIYNELAGKAFGGYYEFRTPVLLVRDPKLVERILIKDFSHFADRGIPVDPENDPLTGSLFGLGGHLWKNLRNKLTPTFTSGKLKGMLDQICNCSNEMLGDIDQKSSRGEAMDVKKLGISFTTNVIASCAFGLQFKTGSAEGNKFRKMAESLFSSSRTLLFFISMSFRPLAKLLRIRTFPEEVNKYFIELVRTTMEYRKKNNIHRNDFLQLLINLKDQEDTGKEMNWTLDMSEEDAYLNQLDHAKDQPKKNKTKVMTVECIAAQSFVFLTAGSEVVANAVAFTLYEVACNPNVQKHLQEELDSTLRKHGGKVTYEGLQEMTYLDMVIQEASRKYSVTGVLLRECTTPYRLPDSDLVIEKGTRVIIPMYSIHNDPAHYPDPDRFMPERFEGNHHRSSGTYLPFGDGPRICIAMRFALLELKACMANVMSQYSMTLDQRTAVPLQFDPKSMALQAVGGIWLKFQRRSQVL